MSKQAEVELIRRALLKIVELHKGERLQFESFSVCETCDGSPEWPCETALIAQGGLDGSGTAAP